MQTSSIIINIHNITVTVTTMIRSQHIISQTAQFWDNFTEKLCMVPCSVQPDTSATLIIDSIKLN